MSESTSTDDIQAFDTLCAQLLHGYGLYKASQEKTATLHGGIKWGEFWASSFRDFYPELESIASATLAHFVIFFYVFTAQCHYGSYELQYCISAWGLLHDKTKELQKLQEIAGVKKVTLTEQLLFDLKLGYSMVYPNGIAVYHSYLRRY